MSFTVARYAGHSTGIKQSRPIVRQCDIYDLCGFWFKKKLMILSFILDKNSTLFMYELLSIWFSVNKLPTKVERQVLKNYIKAWKKVIIIHEKWNQNLSEKVSDENWLTLPIKKISSLKWVSINVQSNLCWLIWLPPILDRYLKEREKLHKLFSIQRTHKIQEWSQLIR